MKKYTFIGAVALFVVLPVVVLAQLPTATIPTVSGLTLTELEQRIRQVVQFLMVIGVILAVGFIIWGGITRMYSQGEEKAVKAANDRIRSGVIGALVVIAVGLILQTLAAIVARSFFG